MRGRTAVSIAGAGFALGVFATHARGEAGVELSPIVVTATRVAASSMDLPVSIDLLGSSAIHSGQLQVNLSESLITVPGVSVQSRQNYAQDLQLSVRGFGARSSFGVRGLRLYADGIPGTMPDGQGQFSQFDLGSADRIEVMRGPFSALYGNSSGGVIAIFTEDAKTGRLIAGNAEYGSFNTGRQALKVEGEDGAVNYVIDAAHFQTDGYRFHGSAERDNFNSKARIALGDTSKLTVIANVIDTPFVQDPLGLTRAQLAQDPRQAGVGALPFNTRKSLDQEQLGVIYENQLSAAEELSTTFYTGHRATTQFQAIPRATQLNAPLYPGGVIDLDRAFWGLDSHLTSTFAAAGAPLQVVAGITYDDLQEARKGYFNFVGAQLGVAGALRRDEANHVYDFDQYVQAQWDPQPRWRAILGVRNNRVEVTSHGHIPLLDGADSSVRYSSVNPVAGITYRAGPALDVYGSYGKGFETPTLNDLAYRSVDGSLPGLNFRLKPARSDNVEAGVKAGGERVRATLAAFYIKSVNELAVLQNSGGRTVAQNIGETNRRGMELGAESTWTAGFSGRLAYTYIRAVVGQAYATCIAAPCNPLAHPGGPLPANFKTVSAGSHLPAVPMNSLYAGLTWSHAPWGFSATLETLGRARIYVDDRNSDSAAGYWTANLRAGFEQATRHWRLSQFARIDNIANRAYVGSVIVNETNSRFFESAPGRTAYVMFNVARRD